MKSLSQELKKIISLFEERSGLHGLRSELQERVASTTCKLFVANPTDRLFQILEEAIVEVSGDSESPDNLVITLKKDSDGNLLTRSEGQAFIKGLAETLNVNRHSFGRDFMSRYTPSVSGAESQIVANANHVVYGRRGAGKSMLLLYALHQRIDSDKPSVWIDLQVYGQRDDDGAIADIIVELLTQASAKVSDNTRLHSLIAELNRPNVNEDAIKKLSPAIRRELSEFARNGSDLFVFLDDFHVLDKSLQPKVLNAIYSVARGNQLFLKISAIETLTRTYDALSHRGLQIPHDAQVIKLDYNLAIPDKAIEHISAILNAQASYSGLPSVRRICTSSDVLPRLTWVSAGVPRDALYLFSQAISKATQAGSKRVSVSNVNQASSETLTIKLRDLDVDITPQEHNRLSELLDKIRDFCISKKRKNAFLIENIANDSTYEDIRTLVDLRLLHIISEGVTIGEAGRKYLALILDYGFYTGVRAARSVDLFNTQSERVKYQDLRSLPVFIENI